MREHDGRRGEREGGGGWEGERVERGRETLGGLGLGVGKAMSLHERRLKPQKALHDDSTYQGLVSLGCGMGV